MPRKYDKPSVNSKGWTDWQQPRRRGYRLRCCDCQLVHAMDFRVYKGRVQFRASRDERATAASRRTKKYKTRSKRPV